MAIIAALAGVSHYQVRGVIDLPYCQNDVKKIEQALSLGIKTSRFIPLDSYGVLYRDDFVKKLNEISCTEEDVFIFYFSGHGDSCYNLCFTDTSLKIQEIINNIYYNNLARYKIIILDCCHAGNFVLDNKVRIGKENLMGYKNKGISILAACGGEETSGFYDHEKMSLFTYLLCQAFTAQYLTKKGKKSLEDIKNHLEFLIEKSLIKLDGQHPIFHTSVVGTVYFDVDEYIPYKMQEIYYESDDYIVYKVEPKHGIDNKAYIVKIILKTAPLNEKIFIITSDIVKKLKYIDVYKTAGFERIFKGKQVNSFFCYFAINEDELLNGIYICRTIWTDKDQKPIGFKEKGAIIENNICLIPQKSYNAMRKLLNVCQISDDEFIDKVNQLIKPMIEQGENLRALYQKYKDGQITIEHLFDGAKPLNNAINRAYLQLSDIPMPSITMREFENIVMDIAGDIYDMSLYYNSKYISKWPEKNRRILMDMAISKYCESIKRLENFEIKN